jgi:hypothetical protein
MMEDPLIDHAERVAAAVTPDARPIAFLRGILEQTSTDDETLRRTGLTELELTALELLTRTPGESYELYVLRIAHAPGAAGRLARTVKLADLDDRLARPRRLDAPPYAWARRHIVNARGRRDGGPGPSAASVALPIERSGSCAAGSHTPDLPSSSKKPSPTPRTR